MQDHFPAGSASPHLTHRHSPVCVHGHPFLTVWVLLATACMSKATFIIRSDTVKFTVAHSFDWYFIKSLSLLVNLLGVIISIMRRVWLGGILLLALLAPRCLQTNFQLLETQRVVLKFLQGFELFF